MSEKLVSGGATVKDAAATYDALGLMTSFNQAATSYANGTGFYASPDIANLYAYDAVGNIRKTVSTHDVLNGQGGIAAADVTETYWYRYDGMNRLVLDRGVLSGAAGAGGTTIVRGTATVGGLSYGQEIQYDYAGQRKHVIRTEYTPASTDPIYGFPITAKWQEVREHYEYYGDGKLGGIRMTRGDVAEETFNPITNLWDPPTSIDLADESGGPLRSYFTYDLMGRQVSQSDTDAVGTTTVHSRTSTYNKIGQLTAETDATLKFDGKTYTDTNTYTYVDGSGNYLLVICPHRVDRLVC